MTISWCDLADGRCGYVSTLVDGDCYGTADGIVRADVVGRSLQLAMCLPLKMAVGCGATADRSKTAGAGAGGQWWLQKKLRLEHVHSESPSS